MANTIFGSRTHRSKAVFHALGLFFILALMQKGQAREFTVGGSGWGVRTNASYTESYGQWAERNRFQIGDSLLFIYPPNEDSVLHVTVDTYNNCSTEAPLEKYSDGHTVFSVNHSGPFYFISGNRENCLKGEKMVVVVLADRSNRSYATTNQTAPAPSPDNQSSSNSTYNTAPAPAPSAESPPSGTLEINPTPAPAEQSPPHNAASFVFTGAAASIGAFLASSIVLLSL